MTAIDNDRDRLVVKRRMALMLIALFIAEVTGSFETAMILSATKALIEQFKDPALVGWLMTGYLLVGAAVAAVIGRLGDIYGRRKILLGMLAIGAIGSLISGFAINYPMLLGGRILQGMTGAILPLCVGLVRENFPREKISIGIGLMISGASAGTALGLVLGGFLVDTFSWHAIFFASAGFCSLSALALLIAVPKSPTQLVGKVDWLSGVMFAPGILGMLLFVTNGPKWGWASATSLLSFGLSALILGWWLRRSLRSADPLLDVSQFRNRNILIANLITALIAVSALQMPLMFSIMLQAPTWTLVGLGVTATVAGLVKLPSNVFAMVGGPLSGWLTNRGGGRLAMIAGGMLTTTGWIVAWFFHDTLAQVVLLLCIISFGATMIFAVGPTILALVATPERTSEVSGMLTVVRQTFLGIGAQVVSTILAASVVRDPSGGASYPSPYAFDLTIGYIIVMCIIATGFAFLLPAKRTLEMK